MSARAPRDFALAVCADCRGAIRKGSPKVSRGTGWLCQKCAYEATRPAKPLPPNVVPFLRGTTRG